MTWQTRTPDPAASRAVLIGTGDYAEPDRLPSLTAARNNARRLAEQLRDPRVFGISSQHCVEIIDPQTDAAPALAVASAARQTTDTLLVYFAGHGLVAPSGELVLGLSKTVVDYPQFSGLRYSWLREALAATRARRTVVILDCCFSGRAIGVMADSGSLLTGQLDVRGAYVLTSTSANKPAAAPIGARYTAFTASLIELLDGGLTDGQPFLSMNDIYEWTRKDMIRLGLEQPLQMGTNQVGALPFLRNLAVPIGAGRPNGADLPDRQGDSTSGGMMLLLEIAAYDQMPPLAQVDAQLDFIQTVEISARNAGLDRGSWVRRPLHNGELICLPGNSTTLESVAQMMRSLRQAIATANADRPLANRLRLNGLLTTDRDVLIDARTVKRTGTAAPFAGLPLGSLSADDEGLRIVVSQALAEWASQSPPLRHTLRLLDPAGKEPEHYLWTPWAA